MLSKINKLMVLWLIIKNTWGEYLEYRLNFVMWRLRNVLRLVVIYFLWWAVFNAQTKIFDYDQTKILTYILLSSFVASLVFATRTQDIGQEISQGDLSNLLLKPINPFYYWLARDIGDKTLNISFSILEITLLFLILKPPFFIQRDFIFLFLVAVALILSISLYFLISLLISFFGFWTNSVWGPRLLLFIILEFLAGSLFPLDILPSLIYKILEFSPFSYLLFFPLKIYLGQVNIIFVIKGLMVSLTWFIIFYFLVQRVWRKGLKIYEAYGR